MKTHRFQFGVSDLLVLILAVSIGLALVRVPDRFFLAGVCVAVIAMAHCLASLINARFDGARKNLPDG